MTTLKRSCKQCDQDISHRHFRTIFCSKKCRDEDARINQIAESRKKFAEHNQDEWVECPICQLRVSSLSARHLDCHEVTRETIRQLYPSTVFDSVSYLKKLSEKIKGDKNPGYQHGGKFSAYSKNFIHADRTNIQDVIDKSLRTRVANNNVSTTIEYFLKKTNGNEAEAKRLLTERQSTFSLQKCIEKYGVEEGTKRWSERQVKWLNSYKKSNFSKISQELFWAVYDRLEDKDSIYFAQLNQETKEKDETGKNNELTLKLNQRSIKPDFINTNTKRIIEFDGTYWHDKQQNPAKEARRDELIVESGYEVLHIKEFDFMNDKQKAVERCLNFLTQ